MALKLKFGMEAAQARRKLKFTQEQVAEAVGITPRSIQYIEKGAFLPKSETMLAIMIFLQMSPTLFSKEVGVDVPVPVEERETILT